MEVLLAIGAGLSFASVAGVRAFLPLVATLSIVSVAGFGNPPFLFMQINNQLSLPVLIALVVLLVLECVLDKFAAFERPLNLAMVPMRIASGAAVFAIVVVDRDPTGLLGPLTAFRFVTLPSGLSTLAPYLIAGAAIAGVVAVTKAKFRPSAGRASTGVSPTLLSLIEDLVAFVGSFLGLLYMPLAISLVPFLLVAFLLLFYYIRTPRHQIELNRTAL